MQREDDPSYIRSVISHIQDKPPLQRSLTQIEHPGFAAQCKVRQAPNVPEPAWNKPTDDEFFVYDKLGRRPNVNFLREHLFREGRVTEGQALYLLEEATKLLRNEQNMLEVQGPITVCGDIHGQFYDLMKIFEIGGDPADNTYLFLGDYVDRGCFGIECILYLYSLKICYPEHVYLLRGNHECRHLTEYFTFQRECVRKYSAAVYDKCCDSFNALPIAALLDRRFLCVHGGISPELHTIADINKVDRFMEPPSHGLLCDLLWSDPVANFGSEEATAGTTANGNSSFLHNPARGCSFFYTYEAACNFLDRNSLLGIIRGHEVQNQGYQMYRKTPAKKFPSVITIFSAPNYCDFYHNRGAVLKYANKNITIRQFNASSHPYWLPNFMDAFTWSLPFVGDKIVQMLLAILSCCTAEELEESSSDDEKPMDTSAEAEAAAAARRAAIKQKIMAVGKMRRVFQLLREEAETASELNAAMEASGLAAIRARTESADALGVRGNQIRRAIRSFDDARRSDMTNERMPEFHESNPEFPALQAPSTRMRFGSPDDSDIDKKFRRTLESEEDDELSALAERVARIRRPGARPSQALKRHDTV